MTDQPLTIIIIGLLGGIMTILFFIYLKLCDLNKKLKRVKKVYQEQEIEADEDDEEW